MGNSRDISEEGNADRVESEDQQEADAQPTGGALLGYPTFTQDQMLRSQAMEYASRASDQDVLARAEKYYKFLKGE